MKEKKVRHKWLVEVEFIDEIPKSVSIPLFCPLVNDRGSR